MAMFGGRYFAIRDRLAAVVNGIIEAARAHEADASDLGDDGGGSWHPTRPLRVVAVGDTNAGKSTLLNTLTKSEIQAEDLLFATLDPTSRRLRFPQDLEVIITDTVGFIRHLPADLLKAFESTLEELFEADLLLHVIDVANPAWRQQVAVVEGLLAELGLEEIPCLKVFNKIDRLDTDQRAQLPLDEGVGISALDAATLTPLLVRAQAMLTASMGRDGQTPIDWRRDEGTGEEG